MMPENVLRVDSATRDGVTGKIEPHGEALGALQARSERSDSGEGDAGREQTWISWLLPPVGCHL